MKRFTWGLIICWFLAFGLSIAFDKPSRDQQLVGVASDWSYKSGLDFDLCYKMLKKASNAEVRKIANEWGIECPDLE